MSMSLMTRRLKALTARDVMTERLVVLRPEDTIQHAANLLRDLHISGAPVVDQAGTPIGLLSTTDIVPAVAARLRGGQPGTGGGNEWADLCALFAADSAGVLPVGEDRVGRWMSRKLVSVRDDLPLIEVARVMCDGHWHRVTVIDAQSRLRGIVSSMDVLAAVVQAADESSAGA
jgi:CBS-domain-containing membrane protein